MRAAHPRSRGENTTCPLAKYFATGSSPLTRGKRDQRRCQHSGLGLIPAHAGKTWSMAIDAWSPQAHPRSRGENFERYASKGSERGSSPLTRGKLLAIKPLEVRGRLIPAHAGKTRRDAGRDASSWAHPRSRGENKTPTTTRWTLRGSSPLTRGKPGWTSVGQAPAGLIPAHAGKTARSLT